MKIDCLDHGYVQLIESWGSDQRIVEAARMSTDKGFRGWGQDPCVDCGGWGHGLDEANGSALCATGRGGLLATRNC
jgi:hypothetical protein